MDPGGAPGMPKGGPTEGRVQAVRVEREGQTHMILCNVHLAAGETSEARHTLR